VQLIYRNVRIAFGDDGAELPVTHAAPLPVEIVGSDITLVVSDLTGVDVTDRAGRLLGRVGVDILTGGSLGDGALAKDATLANVLTRQSDGTQKTQVTSLPAVTGTVTANQGGAPWTTNDNFTAFEALADQAGSNGVLTFTFSSAVDLIWVQSNGGTSRAVVGSQTPSATLGAYCADGTPLPIPIHATVVKVYAPNGATVSVWGERY
jgi:hypothetical protein